MTKKSFGKHLSNFIFLFLFIFNIFLLINTNLISIYEANNSETCVSKINPFDANISNLDIEIVPIYGSINDLESLHCIGKFYKFENSYFVYENIFYFNLIKLLFFLLSYNFFKSKKIKFNNLLLTNSFFYFVYYYNFSFDFLYKTNVKLFSYELIIFEILLLTSFSYFKKDFLTNSSLAYNWLNSLSKFISKNYLLLLTIYLLRISFIYFNYEEIKLGILSEWLINYNFGFIKRGLAGQMIYLINYLTKIPLNYIVFFVLLTFHLLFFMLLKPYFLNLNNNRKLLIVFSPLFIFYNLNLISTILLPKELLGLIALLLIKKYKNSRYEFLSYSFLFFAIFSHEINFIFLIPIFFMEKNRKKLLIIFIISMICTLVIFGIDTGVERIQLLCENNIYLQETDCYKSVAMNNSLEFQKNYAGQIINKDYILIYFIYLLFGLIPLIVDKWMYANFAFIISIFLPILFLSYFTVDWGRWLFILFTIIYLKNLDDLHYDSEINLSLNYYFLILLYNLLWKVPHWGVNENYYSTILRIDKFSFVLIIYLVFNFQKMFRLSTKNLLSRYF